jgi:hypothetical protein
MSKETYLTEMQPQVPSRSGGISFGIIWLASTIREAEESSEWRGNRYLVFSSPKDMPRNYSAGESLTSMTLAQGPLHPLSTQMN